MIAGVPYSELAWLAAIIVAGGVLSGFLAGLVRHRRRGAIIVPILYEVFRIVGVPDGIRHATLHRDSLAIILCATTHPLIRGAPRARLAVLPDGDAPLDGSHGRRCRVGLRASSLFRAAQGAWFKIVFVVFLRRLSSRRGCCSRATGFGGFGDQSAQGACVGHRSPTVSGSRACGFR